MNASRTLVRARAATRIAGRRFNVRHSYATDSTATSSSSGASGALTGGLIGGGAVLAVGYGWYHFSGAKTAVQTAHTAKSYVDQAITSAKLQLPDKPDPNDAIRILRDTANKYASFIPGGRSYVDSAFNDLDAIRKQHGNEVDKIVRDAYQDLQTLSSKGLNFETAGETINVLLKALSRFSDLAGDAAQDILSQHPQLKEKLGGSVDQLKELSDKYGPEAKKQVDDVQDQIRNIIKSGLSVDTASKIQKLVQEKSEKIRQLGEQTFNRGFDELKPMLEKNPQIKEFVEKNKQTLKDGNVAETVNKVRQAISSGNTGDLEEYIKNAKDKGSSQLSQWLGNIPDGSQVLSQFNSLRELANNKGHEAQELLKETIAEIKQVLDNKIKKADQLRKDDK